MIMRIATFCEMDMKKRQITPVDVEIDGDYESRMDQLGGMTSGSTTDYAIQPAGRRVTEPVRQQPASYVPASPVPDRRRRGVSSQQIVQAAQTINTTIRPDDGLALQAMESLSEKSNPIQRGLGFGIVGLIFVAIAGIVSWAMVKAGAPTSAGWTIFAICAFGTVLIAYLRSEEFSPAGVERFKAKMYAKIRGAEIASDERVSMAKIELLRDLQRELDSNDE